MNKPYQLGQDADWSAVLSLIQISFAEMDGRIDPPSSMHQLTAEKLATHEGEVWAIGREPLACVVLTPKRDCLYLGKLSVAPAFRKRGLAVALLKTAEERAHAQGFTMLETEVRIELVENHRFFKSHGFAITEETAHEGYDRPTGYTFQKRLAGHR